MITPAIEKGILGTDVTQAKYDELVEQGAEKCRAFVRTSLELGLFLAKVKEHLEQQSSDLWSQYLANLAEQPGICQTEETLSRYASCVQAGLREKWGRMDAPISFWLAVDKDKLPIEKKNELMVWAVTKHASERELKREVHIEIHDGEPEKASYNDLLAKIAKMEHEYLHATTLLDQGAAIINDALAAKFSTEQANEWLRLYRLDYGGR